jgi:hypothetical protein
MSRDERFRAPNESRSKRPDEDVALLSKLRLYIGPLSSDRRPLLMADLVEMVRDEVPTTDPILFN